MDKNTHIKTKGSYILARELEIDTGVVSERAIADTKQYYEIIEIGDGEYNHFHNIFIKPTVKVGDKVIIMKQAAEGDTPPDLYAKGYALFPESRIMAIMEDK